MNFLTGEGWQDSRGIPLVGWPPLFPLLIAALGWVGIEPLEAGRWVNAIAFGLTILAAGLWLHANLRSRLLVLATSGVIAASLPLTDLASHFLTDSCFVLLTLLALIQLASFLNSKKDSLWPLLWAAAYTALAALTRYPGVVLIGVGVLLLLGRRTLPLTARLKDASVFGVVSSLPLAAFLTRNWVVSGSLTGPRKGSGHSLSDTLNQVGEVFREWVMPQDALDGLGYLLWTATGPDWFGALLWATIGLVVVAMAMAVVVAGHREGMPSFGLGPALPFGTFAGVYIASMVVVPLFVLPVGIGSRYLLPVYVPLLLAAAFLLDRFLSKGLRAGWAAARYGLTSCVLLGALAHSGYSASRNLRITRQAYVAGFKEWTYNGTYWKSSEILNSLRDNRIDGQIYSNNPHLAWFWSRPAALGKHQRLPDEFHYLTSAIMQWTGGDGAHIVWIRSEKSFYDYDYFDIRCLPGVETVAKLSDGVVFHVTAAEPFDAARHRACKQSYVRQLVEQASERVVRADSTWPISTWGAEPNDEQVVRAGWDVYRNDRTLTYRKQPCAPADVHTNFVLQVIPDDPADRQQHGFDNLDFNFRTHGGVRLNDQCVATAQLPDYPIDRIYIGRWIDGNSRTLWDVDVSESR